MSIRAVLFDFGGVLAEEGFRAGLHLIARLNGLDPESVHREGIDAVYESGYVTGTAKEADFWKRMRSRFHFSETDAVLTEIILDHFTLRPEMIDLVRDLRGRGLACAILSDQTDWLDRLDRRDDFYREFDRVYNSYRLGKSKREPSLFDEVVADLALRPGEALFLDDDPGNVERARSRGLRALCCDTATQCRAGLQNMLAPRR
ncbi:MAG: HAD family hydrolase [Thiobacillus sp.]